MARGAAGDRWVVSMVVAGVAALGACGPSTCEQALRPATSAVELRLERIYDAGAWLRRVPVELAVSMYARSKLDGFLDELALPEDVDARVRARIAADDFVDELVPFLLFVRDVYQPPEGVQAETFEDHLRARFAPGDGIPGMEHALFRWQEEVDEGGGMPGVSPDMARQLVAFYDVLYLQEESGAEGLACASRESLDALEAATRQAAPAVRGLLEALAGSFDGKSGVGAELRLVLDDPARLDAATAAVIRFVDQTVCRNYRFFATRAFRASQLEAWMKSELAKPGGGALWAWLEQAQRERRYGGVIVVDGLQGKLLEALARGDAGDPFLRAVVAERQAAGGTAPVARSLRAPEGVPQADFLARLASEGFSHRDYLPFFRDRLADPRTHWVPVGISTTPTISVRNIPIALTGAPVAGPGSTGLPNFHFVDRGFARAGETRGRAYYFFGSDAVELVSLAESAGMQTLFERLPHLGSLSCTAQYDERAHYGIDALLNLGLGETLRDFGERLCAAELDERSRNERQLQDLRRRLHERREALTARRSWWRFWSRFGDSQDEALAHEWIETIAELEQRTLPELWVAYNPWPDHFAHFEGPFADAILSPSGELNRLDYWLGRAMRAYADAGVLDRAVFGLVGDHGLGPVYHLVNAEVEVFDALRAEGIDFRATKISSDEGEGPKLTNPFDPPSMKGLDVVVASTAGGNVMFDFFVDQEGGFGRQPLAHELRAIRPLGQPGAPAIDLLAEIPARLAGSLDYLAVRETASGPEGGSVRIRGPRGGRVLDAVIERRGARIRVEGDAVALLDLARETPYETLSAEARERHAALRARCLAAPADDPEAWCSAPEWRELSSYTPRPDAVVQLAHLYDADRAGTVNLFPRAGVGYNSGVPGRHAGESFHEKNAFVAIWGKPLVTRSDGSRLRSAVNGAVPMAIYRHLAGADAAAVAEGFGYDPVPADWFTDDR